MAKKRSKAARLAVVSDTERNSLSEVEAGSEAVSLAEKGIHTVVVKIIREEMADRYNLIVRLAAIVVSAYICVFALHRFS